MCRVGTQQKPRTSLVSIQHCQLETLIRRGKVVRRQVHSLGSRTSEVIKLDRAEKLLAGLGNESVRWNVCPSVLPDRRPRQWVWLDMLCASLSVLPTHSHAQAASEVLEKNLKFVIGNIVLAGSCCAGNALETWEWWCQSMSGGFIAYTGPFTAEFRRSLVLP